MEMVKKTPLVIYHGGCTDGCASAWVAWTAHNGEVDLYPGVYQNPPPLLEAEGRTVYVVDFSYKAPVMRELIERAASVTVLDHHKTAEAELDLLLADGTIFGVFDMDRCGALITWDWFFGPGASLSQRLPCPELIAEIDKHDRWLDDRDPFLILALRSYPHRLDPDKPDELMACWDALMTRPLGELREEGRSIHRYYRARVDETKQHAREVHIGDLEVPCVNAPYYLASDVAGELAATADCGVGAVWWQNQDGSVTFSLRSKGDVDVSEIAAQHGGGGHKGAAGFKVSWDTVTHRLAAVKADA